MRERGLNLAACTANDADYLLTVHVAIFVLDLPQLLAVKHLQSSTLHRKIDQAPLKHAAALKRQQNAPEPCQRYNIRKTLTADNAIASSTTCSLRRHLSCQHILVSVRRALQGY